MRDAFGGVFMMRLMLAFITIFVAFTAVSLNYAKAFKIKNKVIDFVEQQQITNVADILSNNEYKSKLDTIVDQANYTINCQKSEIKSGSDVVGVCYKGIIIKRNYEHNDNSSIYYDIITYSGWNMGILNTLVTLSNSDESEEGTLAGTWQICGEAKVVKK